NKLLRCGKAYTSRSLARSLAIFFAALAFAHRALCAFAILALALRDKRRLLPRPTPFFPFKISMADLSVSNFFCSLDASLFNPDRRSEEHTSELQSRGHLVCR